MSGHRQLWCDGAKAESIAVSSEIMSYELHTFITGLLPPSCTVRLTAVTVDREAVVLHPNGDGTDRVLPALCHAVGVDEWAWRPGSPNIRSLRWSVAIGVPSMQRVRAGGPPTPDSWVSAAPASMPTCVGPHHPARHGRSSRGPRGC